MQKTIKKFTTDYDSYSIVKESYNGRPAIMLMSSGKIPQSGVGDDDNPEQLFLYTQRLAELAIGVKPSSSLVLGGGGFTVPTALVRQAGSNVTAVEIDPGLIGISRDYFDMASQEEGLSVVVDDAIHFIEKDSSNYDLILVDVFKDRATPDDLMSPRASANYKKLLNSGGVLAFNCISRYHTHSSTVLKRLIKNLSLEFSNIQVYPADIHIDKRSDQNLIVVASNSSLDESCQYMQSYPVDVLL